ncbi:MAG TPA: hypothetical protein VMN35_05380 [Gaiellaceae bacterium]|nr:hypothetical protein [Gaiellaceae bacterium]
MHDLTAQRPRFFDPRALRVPGRLHEPACFVVVAAVYLLYFSVWGDDRLYGDAASYWELGATHGRDGGFSWFPLPDRIRGYAFPLYCYGLQVVASTIGISEPSIIKLSGAVLVSTLGVVVVPRLARLVFPSLVVSWTRIAALNALIFLFWRGHLNYPLTDFPAVLLSALGVLALFRARPAWFAAGLCFGLAANLRPACAPVIAGATVAALVIGAGPKLRVRPLAAALVLQGALIATLPQIAINVRYYDRWSPSGPAAGQVMREIVLTYGLRAQKHETYVGRADGYPSTDVTYVSPLTADPLEREEPDGIDGYREYARFGFDHPIEFVGNLGLHVFNGIDVQYATPYIKDLRDRSILLALLQYTILFVALTRLVLRRPRSRLGDINWIGLTLILLLCVAAVPSAMEPRYFLTLHLLAYSLVCFGPAHRRMLLTGDRRQRITLGAAYAASMLACLALSSAARGQLEHPLTLSQGLFL